MTVTTIMTRADAQAVVDAWVLRQQKMGVRCNRFRLPREKSKERKLFGRILIARQRADSVQMRGYTPPNKSRLRQVLGFARDEDFFVLENGSLSIYGDAPTISAGPRPTVQRGWHEKSWDYWWSDPEALKAIVSIFQAA